MGEGTVTGYGINAKDFEVSLKKFTDKIRPYLKGILGNTIIDEPYNLMVSDNNKNVANKNLVDCYKIKYENKEPCMLIIPMLSSTKIFNKLEALAN